MKKQLMNFHFRRPIRKKTFDVSRCLHFKKVKDSRIKIRTLCGVKRKLCSELFYTTPKFDKEQQQILLLWYKD